MRSAVVLLLFVTAPTWADDDAKPSGARFGIELDSKSYPQETAQEALASVLSAIKTEKFDYLLAHLVDPAFVDDRVKRLYGGRFEEQVADTRTKFTPASVRQLQKFADRGEWSEKNGRATVRLKDVHDRAVMLKKVAARWFLENRNKPDAK